MRRGTTPTHTFTTDLDLRGMTVFITYMQNGKKVFERSSLDGNIEIEKDFLRINLTQAETLSFSTKGKNRDVEIQIRCIDSEGNADACDIIHTSVDRILKDGEIEYEQ